MDAEQMERDGISRICAWTKPRNIGWAHIQRPKPRPFCGHTGCHKRAGWQTPGGPRCFTHTEAFRSDRLARALPNPDTEGATS